MRAARTWMLAGSLAVTSVLLPRVASAGTKECIAAADEGQKLRDDGKLTSARDKFIACAAKACPGAVAKQCSQWVLEAERDLPSLVFRALDEQGKETLDVTISIDGTQVATVIAAHALPLDPGEHTVRFEQNGHAVEDKVLVRPGEKNKMIELSFQPKAPPSVTAVAPPKAAPAPPKGHAFEVPVLAWVGVGVGVVGGVVMTGFALSANSDEKHLRDTCAPSCDHSEKGSIDTKIVLANVGLGVGIAGLGFAVVETILANTKHEQRASASAPPPRVALDLAPGAIGVHGSF